MKVVLDNTKFPQAAPPGGGAGYVLSISPHRSMNGAKVCQVISNMDPASSPDRGVGDTPVTYLATAKSLARGSS